LAPPEEPELELPELPLEEPPVLPVLHADTCVPLLHLGSSEEALQEVTSVPAQVVLELGQLQVPAEASRQHLTVDAVAVVVPPP